MYPVKFSTDLQLFPIRRIFNKYFLPGKNVMMWKNTFFIALFDVKFYFLQSLFVYI